VEQTQALTFALRAAKAAPEALTTSQIAALQACLGYLDHPLVFIRFKANLVRLRIFSVNSHTSERLIKGT
jgi:hypothetical protein